MKGRKKGNMLREGGGQAFAYDTCLRTGEVIGNGIYNSPYFLIALLGYTSHSVGGCHLVLQCRARPDKIKIANSNNTIWVVNNSTDLRPYGIVLFTE